jgi:hypothetical protein
MYNVTARRARGVSPSVARPAISCMMPVMTVGEIVSARCALGFVVTR